MLTDARLRQVLRYIPETGEFIWLVNRLQHLQGKPAGTFNRLGHIIMVDGQRYLRCRLAWLYMTGAWPEPEVDHRDVNRLNDRWSNLREATRTQNLANRPPYRNNHTGLKGISRSRDGTWLASIQREKRRHYLGRFPTPEAAHEAYRAASLSTDGDFARFS